MVQPDRNSQEELFDSSAASSLVTLPSAQLPSIPEVPPTTPVTQATPSVISVNSGPTTAASLISIRSNGERRLVSQEPKSDLFGEHLLPFLDTGSTQ